MAFAYLNARARQSVATAAPPVRRRKFTVEPDAWGTSLAVELVARGCASLSADRGGPKRMFHVELRSPEFSLKMRKSGPPIIFPIPATAFSSLLARHRLNVGRSKCCPLMPKTKNPATKLLTPYVLPSIDGAHSQIIENTSSPFSFA